MRRINFNFAIKDLDGKEMLNPDNQPAILGKMIANLLVNGAQGEVFKFYDWALLAHSGGDILVDNSDYKKLYEFIESNQQLTILTKAQALRYMESVTPEKN